MLVLCVWLPRNNRKLRIEGPCNRNGLYSLFARVSGQELPNLIVGVRWVPQMSFVDTKGFSVKYLY